MEKTWPLAFVSASVHLPGRHLFDCVLVARRDLSVYRGPHRGFHSERAGHVPACAALHGEAGGQGADGDEDERCVGGGMQGVEGTMARGGVPSPGGQSLVDYCLVRGDVSITVGTEDRTLTFLLEGEVT